MREGKGLVVLVGVGHGQLDGVVVLVLLRFRVSWISIHFFVGADLLAPTKVVLGCGVEIVCGGAEQWWWWSPRGLPRGAHFDVVPLRWSCGGQRVSRRCCWIRHRGWRAAVDLVKVWWISNSPDLARF